MSQTITVRHNESTTPLDIVQVLEKVGFNVEVEGNDDRAHGSCSTSWVPNPFAGQQRKRRHLEVCKSCQADHRAKQEKKTLISRSSSLKSLISMKSGRSNKTAAVVGKLSKVSGEVATELSVSGMTCASCANTIADGVKANRARGILSCEVDVMSNSARVVHDGSRISAEEVAQMIEQTGYHAEIVSSAPMIRRQRVTSYDQPADYRLEFHIGGMTCASCSNAITRGLQDEAYIKSVNINLMANSGTVILANKDDAQKVSEAVESMGFICDLGEIAPLRPLEGSFTNDVRLVQIRISGMFCRYVHVLNLF